MFSDAFYLKKKRTSRQLPLFVLGDDEFEVIWSSLLLNKPIPESFAAEIIL